MHIAVIADAYPPLKTSGAVQIRDLVTELLHQGHEVTVILPDPGLDKAWSSHQYGSVTELRLKAPRTKDVSYFRRAIAEFRLSSAMYRNFLKTPSCNVKFDGVAWYSPTIFLGIMVRKLKQRSSCPSYLMLRDIFPEWALDMGLLNKGVIYHYFKSIEKFQYRQADFIGVQTASNIKYFNNEYPELAARVEVLNNWLSTPVQKHCSIQLEQTQLAGRKIFAYTGNIGIAQGMEILVDLAEAFRKNRKLGFVFVGRGTFVEKIRKQIAARQLDNVLLYGEIDPDEIAGFLKQCHIGLVALDPRHRNDNIPGKFLAYMQAGLPVLATVNAGNDLEQMINDNRVGSVITTNSLADLVEQAGSLLEQIGKDAEINVRCRKLALERFSSSAAACQIVAAFNG